MTHSSFSLTKHKLLINIGRVYLFLRTSSDLDTLSLVTKNRTSHAYDRTVTVMAVMFKQGSGGFPQSRQPWGCYAILLNMFRAENGCSVLIEQHKIHLLKEKTSTKTSATEAFSVIGLVTIFTPAKKSDKKYFPTLFH